MLTELDRGVVDWVARLGAVGAADVQVRFGASRSRAYARLARLVDGALLAERRLIYRTPSLYVATRRGLRAAGFEGVGVQSVTAATFEHLTRTAGAAAQLARAMDGWQVLGEREIRQEELGGELLGSVRVGRGFDSRSLHRPDLLLVGPDGARAAIEVELSVKGPERLAGILTGYGRAATSPGCTTSRRRPLRVRSGARRRVPGWRTRSVFCRWTMCSRSRPASFWRRRMLRTLLEHLAVLVLVVWFLGWASAYGIRRAGGHWAWAWTLAFAALFISPPLLGRTGAMLVALAALVEGRRWHRAELTAGGEYAEAAQARPTPFLAAAHALEQRFSRPSGPRGRVDTVTLGRSRAGRPATIPVGGTSGTHTLVVGATGSGKTVTEALIAGQMIERGHAAVVVDPKGDDHLRNAAKEAANHVGKHFSEWSADGPAAYNPYGTGSATELADKAISGETFTEPHYQRQAQRYIGQVVRTMHAAEVPVTAASLAAHMDPAQLENTARTLDAERAAGVREYLDGLSDRQRRDLSGVRDRVALLSESDAGRWLEPTRHPRRSIFTGLSITATSSTSALEADRWPLMSQMLSAAIVSDLLTLTARNATAPKAAVVLIDEFSAVAPEHVAKLFARGRSAGISLILGTQELADLAQGENSALQEQTLGNIAALIAHRQSVPASAELVAGIAGTQETWVQTEQTEQRWYGKTRSGRGSRTRGWEYTIHPSEIKQLKTGRAVVVTPGAGRPAVVAIEPSPAP